MCAVNFLANWISSSSGIKWCLRKTARPFLKYSNVPTHRIKFAVIPGHDSDKMHEQASTPASFLGQSLNCSFSATNIIYPTRKMCRSQRPRGLRRRSTAARLLRSWVRISPGAWIFVVSAVCYRVEVSATGWSHVQRSPTDCGVSLCVI